jgi:hypothetical protein
MTEQNYSSYHEPGSKKEKKEGTGVSNPSEPIPNDHKFIH